MAIPTADITGFTEEQKRLFTQAAELGSGVQTTDSGVTKTIGAPKPITPDAMSGTESPYKTGIFGVEPPPDTSGLDKLISSLTTGSPEQTQAQEAQKSTLQTIQDTMAKLLGEGARKSEIETEKGVLDKQKALNETIAQIRFNNASAFDAAQTQEDRLAPTFAIQGTQAQIERQRAVKNYSLAAVAAVQQDNLALAQDQVQKALDAEFRPLERALEFQKLFLEQNRADLERADKKTADKLNIVLAERARVIAERKADKTAVQNIMLQAAQAGAPSDVLNKMLSSTPEQAISLATQYLGADFKQKAEQIAFENGIKTREMQIKEAEYKLKVRTDLLTRATAGDANAISQLGYDPRDKKFTPEEITKLENTQSTFKRDIDIVKGALGNNSGLQSSSGLIRGGIFGGLFEGGASPLGVLSYATGYTSSKRQDFIADAGYIIKNLTFNKIKELSDQGIKLTPISEKELKAMGDASSVLVSAADFDEAGNFTGFKIPEDKVREQLGLVLNHYENAISDINTQLYLSNSELSEIAGIK